MARLLISFLLLLVGCSLAVAQERIIDEATYYQDIKSAGEYRLKENYRVKRTTSTTTPGPPMTLEIEEIEQPGPKMRVRVFQIGRNETEPSLETVFIGQKVYEKRPGLEWRVEERSRRQAPLVTPSNAPKAEYKDLGIEPESSMRVLQRVVHSQLTHDGATVENTHTQKSWIDRSGRLKKDEYTTTNPKTGSTVLSMEYEIDPSIRIEAPIK